MKRTRRTGFSLIELVIVIVILAVISAIALPRISRGAKAADESALGQNLSVLRSAIELYSAEHGGSFPGADGAAATFIDQLTKYSDKQGTTANAKDGATGIVYGPYLHRIPTLTVGGNAGKSDVGMQNTGPVVGGATGWVYNFTAGVLIANCPDTELSESGTKYNSW